MPFERLNPPVPTKKTVSHDSLVPQAAVRRQLGASWRALEPHTQKTMEARFSADFSQIKVHSDSRLAEKLGMRAFALGQHIGLAPGERATDSKLMAHELAHTLQQPSRLDPISPTSLPVNEDQRLEGEAQAASRLGGARQPLSAAPLQVMGQAKDPRIGGSTSATKPPYSITDVTKKLRSLNLGPHKGRDLVNTLTLNGWRIHFWKQTGKVGHTDTPNKLILLPRDAKLLANVSTLFHEAIHALFPVPGSTGSIRNIQAVWNNLEEEMKAQYQEFLFLKAHAKTQPALIQASGFASDWPRLMKMNKGQLYVYFRDEALVWTLLGKMIEYRFLLKQFGNDISKVIKSKEVQAILNRVILGHRPSPLVKPPAPKRPKFKSLIQYRENFNREMRRSVEDL